jgi:colanic acid/amylovoran biosynthesis glycosyltransferase
MREGAGESLKVGYVLDTFPSRSETFVANEIRWLREAGLEITVLALRCGVANIEANVDAVYGQDQPERSPSLLRMWRLALAAGRCSGGSPREWVRVAAQARSVHRFAEVVRDRAITHLHAHFASLPTALAILTSRLAPVTVSFSAHARDLAVEGRALRYKLARSTTAVVCTEAFADLLRSRAAPTDAAKVVCIRHGPDLGRFRYRPHVAVERPAWVLAAGRLVPKKGFDVLLRAMALLRRELNVGCEIVGDGPELLRLKELARNLGIENAVLLPGWSPYDRLPRIYATADALAVPSVTGPDGDRDGLPNVILEALATGVPVAASRLSGIPEAVRHEETGLLCPPGDPEALALALKRLLTESDLRANLAQRGRDLVEEEFDGSRNARRVFLALLRAAQQA